MTEDHRPLVGRILLIGAVVLAALSVVCWAGVVPVNPGARGVLALAFGIAAFGDAVIGFILLSRARDSRP